MMMKKIFCFILSVLSLVVFFSCNEDKKELPVLDNSQESVGSKSLSVNMTIGLSTSRSFGLSAKRGVGDREKYMSLEDFASDDWNNDTNRPDMYVVVGQGTVIKVPYGNYDYIKSTNPQVSPSVHLAMDLTYDQETDEVRLYLVDKTVNVDVNNARLSFPNQNTLVKPLNVSGEKPKYKIIFYGKTTIGVIKNPRPTFMLKPLGTLFLFSAKNTSEVPLNIPNNTSVTLTTDCFTFDGSVDMHTGLNNDSDTSKKELTFRIYNNNESIAPSNRGFIYGLYVLGAPKEGGSIRLPLTEDLIVQKTVNRNFETTYNGKSVGVNLDDEAKYFIVEVTRDPARTEDQYTKWNHTGNIRRISYRALDNNGEPTGPWMLDVPPGNNNYLARIYDRNNNTAKYTDFYDKNYTPARTPTEFETFLGCPKNTVRVVQWGLMEWRNTGGLFFECEKLQSISSAVDELDLSKCEDMSFMFYQCREFNEPVNFDTSNVKNMRALFYACNKFNQPIDFDTRNVTNMRALFNECYEFNQPVNFSSTSNVTDMSYMFDYCEVFNQEVNFDTRNVEKMNTMFSGCRAFNQPVNFNTSKVTTMASMFNGCYVFNQPVEFDTSNVTTMSRMFASCRAFNQPVNFDTRNVTSMASMFNLCSVFNQPVNFDTRNVTSMSAMFSGCDVFNQPVNFDTSNVTSMSAMFRGCDAFNQPVNFDTRNVTRIFSMFDGCRVFNQPVNFNTSNVTSMSAMFRGCSVFNQPVNFDTRNVTSLFSMFDGCSVFNRPVNFDTSRVTNMEAMFRNCFKFNQNIRNWNVRMVVRKDFFHERSALTQANCPPALW